MEEGYETQSGFIVAGTDATKAFELIEHALDQVALLIEVAVILPRREPMASGRNHHRSALLLGRFHDVIGIVTFVGDDRLGRQPFEQGQGRVIVGARTCRQDEAQGIAVTVAGRVNLGAQTSPRPA